MRNQQIQICGFFSELCLTALGGVHFDGEMNFDFLDGNPDFNVSTTGGLLGASVLDMF